MAKTKDIVNEICRLVDLSVKGFFRKNIRHSKYLLIVLNIF